MTSGAEELELAAAAASERPLASAKIALATSSAGRQCAITLLMPSGARLTAALPTCNPRCTGRGELRIKLGPRAKTILAGKEATEAAA
jgi:hypothetical protein